MDRVTRINTLVAVGGLILAILSLSWQIADKYFSSKEDLRASLRVLHTGRMKVEVVNEGSISAFVEVPYLHLSTENGKGYGFYFDDEKARPRLLAPGDKATFFCRVLEDWQVAGFIAPQRVRHAVVVVNSAKRAIRAFNLTTTEWKERLRSLYSRSTENYDKIDASYVYEQVDFTSMTINGRIHYRGDFYFQD